MCEPAPDDTRYHCLELCWLRSPFSPQEGKRNPPKRHCYAVLKNFPSDRVNKDSVEALFVAILHSGALLGLCWGALGALHRTPHHWGLPSPLPQLYQVTLFVLCLLPPRLVSSIFWRLCADWVSSVYRQGIYHCFCMAWLIGWASSSFPLCGFFCLTMDGKRSESGSSFSFQLCPSKRNISTSDCQTTHSRDSPTYCFFPSFFHVKS